MPSAALASGIPTQITVKPLQTTTLADGTTTTSFTATETDDQGQPLPSQPVTFSSSDPGQSIGSVTNNNDGTYSVAITASKTVGSSTITATDASVSPAISGSATLTQTAGPAATITVGLAPPSIVADGASTTTATATVKDVYGHLLPSESVTFSSTDHGELIGPTTDNLDGTYSAQITASTTVGSPTITAHDGTVSSPPATLTQTAGPPAIVTVGFAPSSTILANGTATTTATATVTDAQGHLLPSETVSFSSTDPGQHIGTVTNGGSGKYSVQITSSTTVGSSTITATDGAVSSPPATLTQTAGPAASIALQLNPPTILADAQSTTSATATVTDAQGHPLLSETGVKFASTDKGQFVGPITNNGDGTYTVQIRGSRTVGSSTVTATDGSATGQATLIQAAGPSTTSLVASTSSPVTNEPVTLVATVNGGTGAPSGTVTFENGGVAIAGCAGEAVSPSSPVATCQTSFAAAGSPAQLTAVFLPGIGSTAPGSTGGLGLDVKPDSTSVGVSTPGSAIAGRRITYIAVVAPPSTRPGPATPSGTVGFFDNGKPIAGCTAQPLVNSTATCVVVYPRAGTHSITASYGGDANFTGSTSPASRMAAVIAPRQILGTLDPTMQWTFHYTRSYTTVVQLIVNGTSVGDIVTVTCHGHGCPFTKRVIKLTKSRQCGRTSRRHKCAGARRVDITARLRSHRLHVGATITVTITRPDWVGKYYVFKARAGHAPRIGISCLAPGFAKPGVACKA